MATLTDSTPAARRKDPVRIRAALLDAAVAVILEHGLARLTVDAVARAAGVTKGGLFHHFASKDELIQGVLAGQIEKGEQQIAALMADDPEPHGRFTRAYLNGVCGAPDEEMETSRALCVAMLGDPGLPRTWTDWVAQQVTIHAATDDNPRCAIVRLAADGIWLGALSEPDKPPVVCEEVHAGLLALTYPTP